MSSSVLLPSIPPFMDDFVDDNCPKFKTGVVSSKRKRKRKSDEDGLVPTVHVLEPLEKSHFPCDERVLLDIDDDDVYKFYDKEKPEYPRQLRTTRTVKVELDKHLDVDVVSLLSGNGKCHSLITYEGVSVPTESLRDKYLLICCFFIPLTSRSRGISSCRAMIASYSQLVSRSNGDFEMVMVAKMRKGWEDNENAFSHFFSAFPCPAIPFSDSDTRDRVCKTLGLTCKGRPVVTVLLDPNRKVLMTDEHTSLFEWFGAVSFPFTDERLRIVQFEEEKLRFRLDSVHAATEQPWLEDNEDDLTQDEIAEFQVEPAVSLEELLSYNGTLERCGNKDDVISVAKLSQKNCVAVYICCDGSFRRELNSIYKACVASDREFEVVVICLPFGDAPATFQKDLKSMLAKHNITSWWLMPDYNDELSRRLQRIAGKDDENDKLIIMRPPGKGESSELMGREVLSACDLKEYPFTRASILESKLSALRSLTLESLLDGAITNFEFKGRKVLLYFGLYDDVVLGNNRYLFKLLCGICSAIEKDNNDDIKVVFVPVDLHLRCSYNEIASKVAPLLVLPPEASCKAKNVFKGAGHGGVDSIVAFRQDGQIVSRRAEEYLDPERGVHDLFENRLKQEILDSIETRIWASYY